MIRSSIPTVTSNNYRGNSGLWFLGALIFSFLFSGSAFASRPDPWQVLEEIGQPPKEIDLLLPPIPVPVDYREAQEPENRPFLYDALDTLTSGKPESQLA